MNKITTMILIAISLISSVIFLTPTPKISHAQILTQETPSVPFFLFVADNRTRNYQLLHIVGENLGVGVVDETLWDNSGTIYVFPSVASTMTVSSTDVDDTLAGTGCQRARIDGLDANYDQITEEVDLDGQNPVTTANIYFRQQGNGLECIQAGASNSNEGTIYVGTGAVVGGVPTNIFNLMAVGQGISKSAFFTVPRRFRGFIIDSSLSVETSKDVRLSLVVTDENGLVKKSDTILTSTPFKFDQIGPAPIFEKRDVLFNVMSTQGAAIVHGYFNVIFSIR